MNQNFKIGPARSLKVYPGDKVDMEVWAYYENASGFGTSSPALTTLITAVSSVFGGASGGGGEAGAIYSGVDDALTAFGPGGSQGDANPGAYLNYILFDKHYNYLTMGWQAVNHAPMTLDDISIPTVSVEQEGYIFVYLNYESESNNYVQFDDFKVTHVKSNILQYNEYYPFGLQTANSWTRENASNRYLYNGGNELNENSGWYETFFREYDAALGRFMQVDPLASSFGSYSPYHYAYNNPVIFNDLFGAEADSTAGKSGGPGATTLGEFINRAFNHSQYGGTWNNGHATYFSSDGDALAAGVDYVYQTNSWNYTYYGSYEATVLGYQTLTRTGHLLSQQAAHETIDIIRNRANQETIFDKVDRKFGSQYLIHRLQIAVPPRFTIGYSAEGLRDYYVDYLQRSLEDKIFIDAEAEFDIHAVFFEVQLLRPDGTSETVSHEFVPGVDPFLTPFVNPGIMASDGTGTPIEHTTAGSLISIMVTFQSTAVK